MEAYYSGSYPASTKPISLLHTVRKVQAKPWKKAAVAPPAPTPIRVYKVDAINFRDLVQQLTGAPEFKPADQEQHQLFPSVAPIAATFVDTPQKPMLSSKDNIAASSTVSSATNWYQGAKSEPLEMNLSSPSSYNWFFVPPISQGNMTSLEPGRVL
ncbi:hypothetical protein AAZX31_11G045300 [Glycine max]|uniref:VQ domain-containing protein n=2 Tax=Glycine subgen. Soja TaxID=1462606 RepID=I1LH46_SOYBN|nr:uncharacterized protein LOC100500571 [Glycine max]XP_028188866.1 uncharacterized protein LOC114375286 [Glycine soja]KAG4993337.1 hypothetical protein JHK86_030164 [Glycine max]KAG5123340.1 hypothetical protein JHK82_030077 [Glycine max]KAG5144758.1 hypothetical protein JHK84_030301 [Glycine max]KAH1157600.1 hypothetical protein GYH30_030032 [Glycine max]KAH1223645.1 VQ motif-containing protein 29 [Glycine max]|eukprot:NP_001236250.2 uncharacterized protein LOC100500571 [Glycine max]